MAALDCVFRVVFIFAESGRFDDDDLLDVVFQNEPPPAPEPGLEPKPECPKKCSRRGRAVCGTNGKTYRNKCYLVKFCYRVALVL